jgi:restriction system protein
MAVPKFDELFNPQLTALRNLGGSGSNAELVDETAKVLGLSDRDLDQETVRGDPAFAYNLAWRVRT